MRLVPLVVGALLIQGCGNSASGESSVSRAEYDTLSRDVVQLKQKLTELESDVEQLDPVAELKLGDQGFATVKTEYGDLPIQWIATSANGAGSKLTLEVGNPYAATLTDVTLYGHSVDAGGKVNQSSTRSWKLRSDVVSGGWSKIPIIVDDVPPNKIAILRISGVVVGGVKLRRL